MIILSIVALLLVMISTAISSILAIHKDEIWSVIEEREYDEKSKKNK